MALFIRQDNERSELQKRLATELQDKANKKALETEMPDGVDDSRYIERTKNTTSLAWVWILLLIIFIIVVIWVIIKGLAK